MLFLPFFKRPARGEGAVIFWAIVTFCVLGGLIGLVVSFFIEDDSTSKFVMGRSLFVLLFGGIMIFLFCAYNWFVEEFF